MSEMQLDQEIYETIRAGITEGGTSFEQARWVIDSLADAGYKIISAQAAERSEMANMALHGQYQRTDELYKEVVALKERSQTLEAENLEQSRLLGMSAERELGLIAELKAEAELADRLYAALKYCAQDPKQMDPKQQVQFMVARVALAEHEKARGK